ncbi:MAG: hypothetical protein NZ480_01610 [Bdellovibrionaceae bacterium]|nr:hypothetical protein [Pseudobdellovibrionaceae bacterium]MDW8189829.1 hypothetical protein [Pseudobdellovibrionaceae bacterium]
MKHLVAVGLVIATSMSSFAFELHTRRYDTKGRGRVYQSHSKGPSGASVIGNREQVLANAEQIAVLNQAYSAQIADVIRLTRLAAIQNFGADQVATMTDQEILAKESLLFLEHKLHGIF